MTSTFGWTKNQWMAWIDGVGRHVDTMVGGHVHACPECYEKVPCEMECSIEPDLSEGHEQIHGGYVVCDACVERLKRLKAANVDFDGVGVA